jgi:phage gp29-like protein
MPIRLAQLERQYVRPDPNDRFPVHYGARATVAAIGSAMRYAEQGDRQTYVDVLRELLEGDPHAFSVLSKRFSSVANKPFDILPAKFGEDNEADRAGAELVAQFVREAIAQIPNWQTHCRGLLWGTFYGVSARELIWRRTNGDWLIDRLEFIHNRRLDYDEQFRLYVGDGYGNSTGVFPGDPQWEGKFFIFEPKLADEYPTREGLGRIIAYPMGFKRFAWRDMMVFVESRGKSLVDVEWKSGNSTTASAQDIEDAHGVAQKVASGLGAVAHSDAFSLSFKGQGSQSGTAGSNTPHTGLIDLCDAQESEAVLGGHLTTGTSKRGEGAQAETQSKDQDEIICVDGRAWDEAVQQFVVRPLVILNFGRAAADKYLPTYHTKVEPAEDDKLAMETVTGLVDKGVPVPTVWASERFGIPHAVPGDVVMSKDGTAVAYVAPVEKDPEDDEPEPVEPDEPASDTPPVMPDMEGDSTDAKDDSTQPDEGDGEDE